MTIDEYRFGATVPLNNGIVACSLNALREEKLILVE